MNSRNKLMLKWIGSLYILGTIIVATTVVSITFLLGKDISMDMLTHITSCVIYIIAGMITIKLYWGIIYKDFGNTKSLGSWIWQTIMFSIIYLIINILLTRLLYLLNNLMITHNEQIISGYDNSGIVTVLSVIAMCFMGPLVEEILFRYIYQNWLVSKMKMCNGIIAIVIVSISFGMIHSGLSVLELSYYSILGLILGLIYDHTDSITMVIMIHMINNTVGILTD